MKMKGNSLIKGAIRFGPEVKRALITECEFCGVSPTSTKCNFRGKTVKVTSIVIRGLRFFQRKNRLFIEPKGNAVPEGEGRLTEYPYARCKECPARSRCPYVWLPKRKRRT